MIFLPTVGMFALIGHFLAGRLIHSLLLCRNGFSVHDTIVVFDRIRENVRRFPDHSFLLFLMKVSSKRWTIDQLSMTILITLAALLFMVDLH